MWTNADKIAAIGIILVLIIGPLVLSQSTVTPTGVPTNLLSAFNLLAIGIMIVIVLIAFFLYLKYEYTSIRLIITGIAMILFGTVFVYFAYYNGDGTYSIIGLVIRIVGLLVWIAGDWKGGAFNQRIAALLSTKRLSNEEIVARGTARPVDYINKASVKKRPRKNL